MALRNWRGRAVLACLYLTQDIGFAFFFTALVAILRQRGVALEHIGLVNLIGLAWALRFVWAPLVDRFGRYRTWLLATQAALVAVLLVLSRVDPRSGLPALVVGITVVLLLSATQELAVNGLSVRLLPECERASMNGLQMAAAGVGIMAGGAGVLTVYTQWGWSVAMVVLATVYVFGLLVAAAVREPSRPASPPGRAGIGALVSFLRRPGRAGWVLVVIPLSVAGIYTAEALVVPMLVDAGWSLQRVGLLRAGLAEPLAVLAALGAGTAIARLGRRRSAAVFGIAQVAAVAALPVAVAAGPVWTAAAVVALSSVSAAMVTAVFTIAMDISRRDLGATDYSLQFSVVGVCRIGANSGGLAIAGVLGYAPTLALAAAVAAAGTVLTYRHVTALSVASFATATSSRPSAAGSGGRS
ncbi:MFS transporter [Nonomuraea polychroma]|uniref:MFS transporter n=1 Tax=Nonomuraea polychroma TaxID=46176 RepID=UPI003D92DBD9